MSATLSAPSSDAPASRPSVPGSGWTWLADHQLAQCDTCGAVTTQYRVSRHQEWHRGGGSGSASGR